MIRSSKSVRVGLVMIAFLAIMVGWIFRDDFLEKDADRRSSESFEKRDYKTKSSRIRMGDLTQKRSVKAVAGDEIPDELTPAQASLLFEEFKSKHPGNIERLTFASEVMKKLCELGYTQEAWDLIEKDQGGVRGNQIMAFFANAKLTNGELLGKTTECSRTDLHASFRGLMERFEPEKYEEFISSSDFKKFLGGLDLLNPKEAALIKNMFSSGLSHEFTIHLNDTPDKATDLLQIASRLSSKGILDTSQFMDLVARFGRSNPFENWALISGIKSEGEDGIEEQRNIMIGGMLQVDAPKALLTILDNGNPAKASDINSVVQSWVSLDSRGATDWYQQNQATMNPQDRDAIAAAFSTHAGRLSEFSGAQQWAEQIRDPKLKAEVIQKIAEVAAAKEERDRETQ